MINHTAAVNHLHVLPKVEAYGPGKLQDTVLGSVHSSPVTPEQARRQAHSAIPP